MFLPRIVRRDLGYSPPFIFPRRNTPFFLSYFPSFLSCPFLGLVPSFYRLFRMCQPCFWWAQFADPAFVGSFLRQASFHKRGIPPLSLDWLVSMAGLTRLSPLLHPSGAGPLCVSTITSREPWALKLNIFFLKLKLLYPPWLSTYWSIIYTKEQTKESKLGASFKHWSSLSRPSQEASVLV